MKFYHIIFLCIPSMILAESNDSKKKLNLDLDHLKFDFMNILGDWVDILSEKELDFRYFEAHDYDHNQKLDGLELYAALGHDLHHSEEDEINIEPLLEIERQVDDIFIDHDGNNDGFLDFKEFLSVQKSNSNIDLEKPTLDADNAHEL